MAKIMIVEDDAIIREELGIILSKYGYQVVTPAIFNDIVLLILNENPDLILLDINLPLFDGYYICREIRKQSNVPIIIVTSRDTDMDELMSMNLGADDFVTKPYNTQVLIARISAVLNRSLGKEISHLLTHEKFQVNLSNATLITEGKQYDLTKNEMKILACLMMNRGVIISREILMEELWQSDFFVDDRALTVNITRLRKTLEAAGLENMIETKRGLGYIIT